MQVNKTLTREFKKTEELFMKTNYPAKGICNLLFYVNALFTGITYKVNSYSQIMGKDIDINKIRRIDKSGFRIITWE